MRTFILLLLFSANSYCGINALDKFVEYQNKDGSFGLKNKEVVTASVLMPYIYRGILPSHKKYGSLSKNALKFLCSRALELSREPVDERHLYTIWALSDAFTFTRVSVLEESCIALAKSSFADLKKRGEWNFENILTKERLVPALLAFNSLSASEMISINEKEMISSFIQQAQFHKNYDKDFKLILELMKKLWGLELAIKGQIKEVKGKNLDLSPEVIAEFISGFNNSSQLERSKTLEYCLLLNDRTLEVLLDEFENSAIIELNLAAKEIKKRKPLNLVVKDVKIEFETENISAAWLYVLEVYSYTKGRQTQDSFNSKLFKKYEMKWTDKDHSFHPVSMKVVPANNKFPKVLSKATSIEQSLLNAAFGLIALDELKYDCLKMSIKTLSAEK